MNKRFNKLLSARIRQQVLVGTGIFLVLVSIGFSFGNDSSQWFWQKAPYFPVVLVGLAFLSIRYWMKLELEKQKQFILRELKNHKETAVSATVMHLLSNREQEVLKLIVDGLNNKEISDKLFISHSTVKTHINNIYKILDVRNRREAIEKAGLTTNLIS